MGFFDFLSRNKATNARKADTTAHVEHTQHDFEIKNGNITVFKPTSFDDVAKIIDHLLLGQPVIVHLTAVRETTAQRVIDILTGAIYAINGNLSELQKEVYIFTPNGVRVN